MEFSFRGLALAARISKPAVGFRAKLSVQNSQHLWIQVQFPHDRTKKTKEYCLLSSGILSGISSDSLSDILSVSEVCVWHSISLRSLQLRSGKRKKNSDSSTAVMVHMTGWKAESRGKKKAMAGPADIKSNKQPSAGREKNIGNSSMEHLGISQNKTQASGMPVLCVFNSSAVG